MFLLASAKKDLSMCSFRLFGVQKPKEEEVWSTEVTKEDLENAVEDEYGVKYSKDWKRLLKAPTGLNGRYFIKEGVKVIGEEAFINCIFIKKIVIPNSVKRIGNGAFTKCHSLENIYIPKNINTINGNPFFCWNGSLTIESNAFIYENYVLFNKNKTILIAYRSKNSNYTIPKSVSTIGDFAFGGSDDLQKIIIPNSVNSIGDGAFALCCRLESIIIPKSIKIIKQASFYGCKTLKNIDIPQSVTTIKKGAFYGCKSLPAYMIFDIIQRFGKEVFDS